MGLFRRRAKPNTNSIRVDGPDTQGPRTVHERIEVTVEREWVSMVVRKPAATPMVDGKAAAEKGIEAPVESVAGESGAKKLVELAGPEVGKDEEG